MHGTIAAMPVWLNSMFALIALTLFCGCRSPLTTAEDMRTADAAPVDLATDQAGSFASQVASANASCSSGNCVVALPSVSVGDGAAVHGAVAQFLATWAGTSVDDLQSTSSSCGTPNHIDCATQLQHDLFKGDGCRGTATNLLAKEVIASATDVEEVVWTPVVSGLSQHPFVTLAGRSDGILTGLAFAFERACPGP